MSVEGKKVCRGERWESGRDRGRTVEILEVMDQMTSEKSYVLVRGEQSDRKAKISLKELFGRYKKLPDAAKKTQRVACPRDGHTEEEGTPGSLCPQCEEENLVEAPNEG